jgi:Fe2+ transport system protein FeoA
MDRKDAAMLRAMGLRPQATVRLCRLGEPCIIEVMSGEPSCSDSCRIGLARVLAERVMVKPPATTPLTTSAARRG